MRVVIAGGGIGGLCLALALHAAGIDDLEILEAGQIQELGVGINVLPHAVRELSELDLAGEMAAEGLATSEFVMFNKHGQRIWGEPRGLAAGYRWPQYSIHRGRLLGVLHRAFAARLGAGKLHPGQRVVSVGQHGSSVFAEVAGGTRVEGDVLVGADGVHSVVRGHLHPGEGAPLWNGITMWRAVAPGRPCLTGSSMVMIGYFGKRAVVYPITRPGRDGRALINVVLEATTADGRPMPRQDWDHVVNPAEIRALFSGMRFGWIDVGALIDGASRWWQYPMVDRDPLPRWRSGRITLLGDAAHPMYPAGANGASQAILDARVLARALALAPTAEAALEEYESERRPATAAVVLANREAGPEKCMELAETRAPGGFGRVEDVFAPGELRELSSRYKRVAGFDPALLNNRPSLSVGGLTAGCRIPGLAPGKERSTMDEPLAAPGSTEHGSHVRYLELINSVSLPLPPMPVADLGPPQLSPLTVPLRRARVMLLGSAGVHVRGEPPFTPVNDLSFRLIPADIEPSRLRPSHPTPMRRPGLRDINVVFPYQRLAELAAEGFIGGVTGVHLSMLGAIKRLRALADEVAPMIAAQAREQGADLLFVVPLCPACHQAMGVIARAVERCGLPTVSSTNARDITGLVKPPRSGFLDFPLGNSVGAPLDNGQQRAVCRDILGLAGRSQPAGMLVDLPYEWPDPGWAQQVAAQYQEEADVLRRQRASEFHDGVHYAADEVQAITGRI